MAGPFRPSWARPARRAPRFVHDTLAVTPVIGTILILGISAVGISAVMAWGVPSLQDTKTNTEVSGILTQFETFDAVATNVMHGGSPGKASGVNANLPGGQISRTQGDWFVIEWYPKNSIGPSDTHLPISFDVAGFDDPVPSLLTITNTGSALSDPKFVMETVYDKTFVNRDVVPDDEQEFVNGWPAGLEIPFVVADTEEFKTYPTRIQVSDIPSAEVLVEFWIFPMGALEYSRETESQGPIKLVLENAAVLSQRLDTSSIRDKPMITKEVWDVPAGEPKLVVLFLMLLVDDPEDPGVTAAGAGTWPLLFSLKANNLRSNSTDVVSSSITVTGDRADTWLRYYVEKYAYVREAGTNTVTLDAGPTKETYKFVLMETLMELSLIAEGPDITPRPPPPPPGTGSNPGGSGNGSPCNGAAKSCGWGPVPGNGVRNVQ